MTYTIEQLRRPEDFTSDVRKFISDEIANVSKLFGDRFNFKNFVPEHFAQAGIFLICRREGEIRGVMLASLTRTHFDFETAILRQVLFYVKPHSGRTAYQLFKKFIDIGKSRANHIITTIASQTNIKASTLQRMGFKEVETLYRMEI